MNATRSLDWRAALSFLALALIWGSTWIVIKGQIAAAPPAWTVAWRFLLAAPAMFALALLRGDRLRLTAPEWRLAAVVGLLQFCANLNFVYNAEVHLTSGIVAVLFVLIIVSNAVFARLLNGETTNGAFWAGGGVALGGMILLLWHETRTGVPGGNVVLGTFFALMGVLTASLANVVQAGRVGKGLPLASLLAWGMTFGVGANLLLAFATEGVPTLPTGAAFWAGLTYLAIAGSVVTFSLYYTLIRRIGAGRAAYQNIFVIIVAMLISTVVEDYRWSILSIAGAGLALLGTWMALRARAQPPESVAQAASPSRQVG